MNAFYTAPVMSGLDIAFLGLFGIVAGSLLWIALHHRMVPMEDEEYYDDEDED
jgi:hypothetical protein